MLELSQADRELLSTQTKDHLTVHSLRHTHASWMAISGDFNLMEIRDQLGHKTTKMTERYAHLMPKDSHCKTDALFDSV
jgi:integrase